METSPQQLSVRVLGRVDLGAIRAAEQERQAARDRQKVVAFWKRFLGEFAAAIAQQNSEATASDEAHARHRRFSELQVASMTGSSSAAAALRRQLGIGGKTTSRRAA